MENLSEEKQNEETLLKSSQTPIGGFRTLPFIIGNSAFLFLVIYALTPDMILYLMKEYHMDMASGSNVLYLWSAALNFTPVIGALLADSFVGRFQMIGLGSGLCLVGMAMFWLTSVIPQARPHPCNEYTKNCSSSATTFQLSILFTSFIIVALGSGAARSCSLAFGADQLHDLQNTIIGSMERYFGWYYAISTFSVLVAMTVLVYIQENMGWGIGYGVLVLLMLISLVVFFLGSSFYVKPKAKESLIIGLIQVVVASYRKRNLKCSLGNSDLAFHQKGSTLLLPSEKLSFLNKACIIQDPQRDLTSDGRSTDPWNLCTVDQVEELKALIKVIPIWFTGVIMSINVSQGSFGTLQATTMDRHIGSTFQIPAGSVGMFTMVSIILYIVLYDRVIVPVSSRVMRKPVHFSTRARMGSGIFVSLLSVAVAAAVETVRRRRAIDEGHADNPDEVVGMSVLWLVPSNLLAGFAEGLSAVAQNEFYISEFPKSMSSIASSMFFLGLGFASLLASVLMSVINDLSGGGSNDESWISSNINKGHYDYYQWILAGLSLVNLLLFFVCSRAYGPCKDDNMEAVLGEDS